MGKNGEEREIERSGIGFSWRRKRKFCDKFIFKVAGNKQRVGNDWWAGRKDQQEKDSKLRNRNDGILLECPQ